MRGSARSEWHTESGARLPFTQLQQQIYHVIVARLAGCSQQRGEQLVVVALQLVEMNDVLHRHHDVLRSVHVDAVVDGGCSDVPPRTIASALDSRRGEDVCRRRLLRCRRPLPALAQLVLLASQPCLGR